MRILRLILALLFCQLLLTDALRAQGKLSSVRNSVRAPDPPPAPSKPKGKKNKKHHHHDDDDDDDRFTLSINFGSDDDDDDHHDHDHGDDSESISLTALFGAIASPWYLPAAALEEDDRRGTTFASFPYNHNQDGYLMFDTHDEKVPRNDTWAIRLLSEYGTDFDGLDRYGGRLFVETAPRLGLDIEWNQWSEDLGPVTDVLWTGDANLIYRFAESEHALFYTGIGGNWLADQFGTDAGFNFTYGFDLFPVEPIVLSNTLDYGRIDSAELIHARSTAGVVFEHVELFAGYDFRKIGGVNISGFVGGLTLWW